MITIKEPFTSLYIVLFVTVNINIADAQIDNPIISAIKKEVDNKYTEFKNCDSPSPFFISYAIIDQYQMLLKASNGAISQFDEDHAGWGMPTLYVGDYLVNNEKMDAYTHSSAIQKVNLDIDNVDFGVPIRDALDNRYTVAVQAYEKKKGMLNYMTRTPEEEALPDFEKTPAVDITIAPEMINIDRDYWEKYACAVSDVAKKYPEIIKSDVTIDIINAMAYYYNTEGTYLAIPIMRYEINYLAMLVTDDGEKLQNNFSILRSSADRLPDVKTFSEECEKRIEYLLQLKDAPVVDASYKGPVLCQKESLVDFISYSFFNIGMMVWHRDLDANYVGLKTFETEMGKRLISNLLTVKSLSGTKMYKGHFLDGYYPVDCEGVIPAEELVLIENGVLINMLNGRIPSLKNPHSNGHKRFMLHSAFQNPHFLRPSTDIFPGVIHVTSQQTDSDAELKQKLIATAREAGLDYAYIIGSEFGGGAIRVYVEDGKEELVRGLYNPKSGIKVFQDIIGVSKEEYISTTWDRGSFTSYIIPKSILFHEIEIAKFDRAKLPAFLQSRE